MHCGNDNYTYGIFDPPGAVPPVSGLLPTTVADTYTSTYESASALPTTPPVQETSQAPPAASTTPTTEPAVSPPPDSGNLPASSNHPDSPATTPLTSNPTSAAAIATVGSQTISAIPGSSGVVLPNGSTAKPGSVATITDSNSKPVVVSVGSSGVFIGGTSQGDPTSFFANPTPPHGPPPLPPTSTAIAVIGGQTISAAPGDSTILINGQTITSGGSAVTLAGSNNVASLGSSGLVVQFPSGTVSTFTLPTATPDWVTANVDGITVSASAGATVVWVGSLPVTSAGAMVTVGNDVVSLGPNGLEVMMPGGGVTTFSLPVKVATSTAVEVLTTDTTSSKALGPIIASSMSLAGFHDLLLTLSIVAGVNQPDKAIESPSSSSISGLGVPTAVNKGLAARLDGRKEAVWLWLTFSVALRLMFGQ
jgi:hypothetical protein